MRAVWPSFLLYRNISAKLTHIPQQERWGVLKRKSDNLIKMVYIMRD